MNEIFKRVSMRKYADRPVEPEKIEKILRAAMAAPSAVNRQPWEFFVVTDPEIKTALSKSSDFAMCAAKAPVVLVLCTRKKGLDYPEFDHIDMAAATENALLEITAQGLGGVWLGVAPLEDRIRKVNEILGLGEDLEAFALVPFGYPGREKVQEDRFDPSRVHYR